MVITHRGQVKGPRKRLSLHKKAVAVAQQVAAEEHSAGRRGGWTPSSAPYPFTPRP